MEYTHFHNEINFLTEEGLKFSLTTKIPRERTDD